MSALDQFGEFLIRKLRDTSIDFYDKLVQSHWKAPRLKSLQKELEKLTEKQREIVRRCVVASIDNGVHDLLFALQESHDNDSGIAIVVDGKGIAEESDGLHGELFTKKGWYARFSKHGEVPNVA